MVLHIRQKQRDAILRILNFNEAVSTLKQKDKEEIFSPYKVLVLDSFSKKIIAPLISGLDLRQKGGVTLRLTIDTPREPIPDVPAVYFIQATEDNIDAILQDAERGLYDRRYVRRMRRLNLTGKSTHAALAEVASGMGFERVSQSNLLSWAGTSGVKKLLAGEQQAAVTVAVEGLMECKAAPEFESFAAYDPKAPPGKHVVSGGPYKEAIVCMVGGGNYLEAESLITRASRAQPPKSVIYGATALLTGSQFVQQLEDLGARSRAS